MKTCMQWLGAGLLAIGLTGCGNAKAPDPAPVAPTGQAQPQPGGPVLLAKPDPEGFPQATPDEALDSVIKSLREKRMDYFLSHLVTPDVRQRILVLNNLDLNAAAQKQLANKGQVENSLKELELFKKEGALSYGKLGQEIEEDGQLTDKYVVFVAIYKRPDSEDILQFERIQNRWCFNTGVRAPNENVQPLEGPPPASAPVPAPTPSDTKDGGEQGTAPDTPAPAPEEKAAEEKAEADAPAE